MAVIHNYNAGYAVVGGDPNTIASLQTLDHKMKLAISEDGNQIWRFVPANNPSSRWVILDLSDDVFSGNYNDLSNLPTIPTNNNQLTNGAGYLTSFDITTQTDPKYLRSDSFNSQTGGIRFTNNTVISLGDSSDVGHFHNGTDYYTDIYTGDWFIRDAGNARFTFGRTTGNFTATGNIFGSSIYAASTFSFGTSTSEGEYITRSGNDINIVAGGSSRMWIDGDAGNVGIGTTAPSARLHVREPSGSTSQIKMSAASNEVNYGYLTMLDNTVNTAKLTFGTTYGYNTPVDAMTIFNGNVGIGTTDPSYKLDVSGTGRFTSTVTATNFILSSDKRLKKNIKDVDTKEVIVVDWKTFELKEEEGQKRYGVVAQELEENHPEFVRTDKEGIKSVAYIDLLIAKIAELEARLEKAGI